MHAPRTGWWPLRLRRCQCGLPWPCQDAGLEAVREHYGRGDNIGAWEAQGKPGANDAAGRPTTRREPGGNDAGGPPTSRRDKHDNRGSR
jgi:hypothetical protein